MRPMPCLSTDVVRHAIEPRVREIGGDGAAVEAIALDAAWALICFYSATPSPPPLRDDR